MSDIELLSALNEDWFEEDIPPAEAVVLDSGYVKGSPDAILYDINLTITEGECFGIVGPGGAGKTTLLHVILGLKQLSQGQVELFSSFPTPRLRRNLSIGYLPQFTDIQQNVPATLMDYILMGLRNVRGPFRRVTRMDMLYMENLLMALHLEHKINQPVGCFSPGDQHKIQIIRALAAEPKFLVLDEPFQGLDPQGRKVFVRLLADLQRRTNATIIMTAQDGEPLTAICDNIACLNHSLLWTAESDQINSEVWADPCNCLPLQDGDETEEMYDFESEPEERNSNTPHNHPIQFWR